MNYAISEAQVLPIRRLTAGNISAGERAGHSGGRKGRAAQFHPIGRTKETIMTAHGGKVSTRAVVLGGGGVTGIAWEIGILAGLHEAEIFLAEADAIIGTSAGAFVGVALASGFDMHALFAAQAETADAEIAATASKETMTSWYRAFAAGGSDEGPCSRLADCA